MKKNTLCFVIFTILITNYLFAQNDFENITYGKYRYVHSDIMEEDRLLYIHLPDDYESSNDSYSVVFQLYSHFTYNYYLPAIRTTDIMGENGQAPKMIVVGIKNQDLNFVYLVLFAQLFLFVGKASLDIIRSWILLHLSTRINISLISDFFIKLMKLPISFFDVRMTGDILQRINDHKRIERILTTSSLTILFSFFNLIVFSFVLGFYSLQILGVFAIGSALYFTWVLFFFKKRKELDYKRFSQVSQEQSKVIELINGMQEIKLHNAEKQKRWSWEYLQARLFKISMEGLALEQYQNVGSGFINEFKNILITVFSAKLVIEGDITLGMMLSIQYIIGQLNAPIQQLIGFIYSNREV